MAIEVPPRPSTHFRSMNLHEAVVARFDLGLFGDARGGSADVERAHRELRAGLADGLRGDDADRFAEFDHAAGGQVAAVAARANSAAGFAGEHGTDLDALDAGGLNRSWPALR